MIAMWDERAISFGKRDQLALVEAVLSFTGTSGNSINVIAIVRVTWSGSVYFRGVLPQQPGC